MASTINTNTYSLNAQTNLAKNSLGLRSALERLSSGLRVNSARDDATGLASGMKIDAASRVTAVEIRKEGDKISSAQIADGALSVVGDIVSRIMELTAMGGGTAEIALLTAQATTIQADANTAIGKFGGTAFTAVAVATTANEATLISVSGARTTQGSIMNNSEFAIQSKQVSYESQQAARSRIMDADFAEETSRLSRFQILQQAGTAMVAQANAIPQNVLTLLR
jgi:flagellin